jgi:hypothetical protein
MTATSAHLPFWQVVLLHSIVVCAVLNKISSKSAGQLRVPSLCGQVHNLGESSLDEILATNSNGTQP